MDLKSYIFDNKLTVKQFANLCGVPERTLYRLISGSAPQWYTAHAIQKATNGEVEFKRIRPKKVIP